MFHFYLISQCNHCGKLLPSFAKSDQIGVHFPEILNYNTDRNPKLDLELIVETFDLVFLALFLIIIILNFRSE